MVDIIENGIIEAAVKTTSAELVSLKSCEDQLEYLWQDGEGGYAGHSPLLFPIVGNLPDDKYIYEGKSYEMGTHGIADILNFELVEKKRDFLFYQTRYTRDTLKQYPFKFSLGIRYTIHKSTIKVELEVINLDPKCMLFSIGGHPYFNCPLYNNETMNDYMLVFDKPETIKRRIKETLLTGEAEELLNNSRELKLFHALFNRDAIILEGTKSQSVELQSHNHQKAVRVDYPGFPYLGIWSRGNSPFVCIEPWFGIDSTHGGPQDLAEKEGMLRLDSGDFFNCAYQITLK